MYHQLKEKIHPSNVKQGDKTVNDASGLKRARQSKEPQNNVQESEGNEISNEQEQHLMNLEKSIEDLRDVIFGKLQPALRRASESLAADFNNDEQGESIPQTEIVETFLQTLEEKEKLEIEARSILKSNVQHLQERNQSQCEEIDYLTRLVSERDEIIAMYQAEARLSQKQNRQVKGENITESKEDTSDELARLKKKMLSREAEYASNLYQLL